jgi:hypothetical protein
MNSEAMTEKEFAKVVGVSAKTVSRFRLARKIDYHRAGYRIYYLPEDVESWHRKMKREAIWGRADVKSAAG